MLKKWMNAIILASTNWGHYRRRGKGIPKHFCIDEKGSAENHIYSSSYSLVLYVMWCVRVSGTFPMMMNVYAHIRLTPPPFWLFLLSQVRKEERRPQQWWSASSRGIIPATAAALNEWASSSSSHAHTKTYFHSVSFLLLIINHMGRNSFV